MLGRGYATPRATVAFERGLILAHDLDEEPERLSIYQGIWTGNYNRGEPESMRRMADALLKGVAGREGTLESSMAHRISGVTRFMLGDYVGGCDHFEKSLASYDAQRDRHLASRYSHDSRVATLSFFCSLLWALGDLQRARDAAEQALAHGSASGHVPTLAYAMGKCCQFEQTRLDPVRVLQSATALVDFSCEHGLPWWLAVGTMMSGWANWRVGDREAGLVDMKRGKAMIREQGILSDASQFCCMTADVEFRAGRFASALRVLDDVLVEDRRTQQVRLDAEVHRHRGEILLKMSPPDAGAAEIAFTQALAIARTQQTRTFELRASLDLARLYCDTGREREARELLGTALVGFTETPELPEIGEAQRLLASLGGEIPAAPDRRGG